MCLGLALETHTLLSPTHFPQRGGVRSSGEGSKKKVPPYVRHPYGEIREGAHIYRSINYTQARGSPPQSTSNSPVLKQRRERSVGVYCEADRTGDSTLPFVNQYSAIVG